MAVYLYEGLPGSGKSYHVLKDTIINALKENRRVFHNLPIINSVLEASEFHIGYLRRRLIKVNQDFLLQIPKYKKVLENSLLVIDEAHETFFSGEKIQDSNLRNFWTYHRHYGVDVVVCTQVKTNLHKIIQSVIAARFEFRNLGLLGLKGLYEIKMYEGFDGKTALGKKRGRFVKKYFDYYFSVDFGNSNLFKLKAPTSFNIFYVIAGLLFLFGLGAFAFSSMSFFGDDDNAGKRKAARHEAKSTSLDSPRFSGFAEKNNASQNDSKIFGKTKNGKYRVKVGEAVMFDNGLPDGGESENIKPLRQKLKPISVESEAFNKKVAVGRYEVAGFMGVGAKNIYILKNDRGKKMTVQGSKSLQVGRDIRVY
ncbi:hypothetical protein JYT60_00715 [bacterium AH-315-C08]|nr:hypothetical protein [bacterium AH-315-C08]MBN4079739.1 hypothetical protein [bacterium AH-315-C08]